MKAKPVKQSQKAHKAELEQEEWDFSKCPEDQLSLCLYHEYGRELAIEYRKYRAKIGQPFSPELFAKNFDFFYFKGKRLDFKFPSGIGPVDVVAESQTKKMFTSLVCGSPGFPDTPFLQIRDEEWSPELKVLRLALPDYRPDRHSMLQMFSQGLEIIRTPAGLRDSYEANLGNLRTSHPSEPLINDFAGMKNEMTMAFINWSLSNTKLTEDFAKWLDENRPDDITSSSPFSVPDLKDLQPFARKLKFACELKELASLKEPANALSEFLYDRLDIATKNALANYQDSSSHKALRKALVKDLNDIIVGQAIYDVDRFAGVTLRSNTAKLLSENPSGEALVCLNRLLIEDAYPMEILRSRIKHVDFRGSSTMTEMLQFLSVRRLLAAMSLSEARPLHETSVGKLYEHDSDWHKSGAKSGKVMEELFTPFFIFRDGKPCFDQD